MFPLGYMVTVVQTEVYLPVTQSPGCTALLGIWGLRSGQLQALRQREEHPLCLLVC